MNRFFFLYRDGINNTRYREKIFFVEKCFVLLYRSVRCTFAPSKPFTRLLSSSHCKQCVEFISLWVFFFLHKHPRHFIEQIVSNNLRMKRYSLIIHLICCMFCHICCTLNQPFLDKVLVI